MDGQQYITLKDGTPMPKLGMGTWCLGDYRSERDKEIDALRAGLDAGIKMIDTAEMYGEGKSEKLVGEALRGYRRENLFLVSKVYPHNAGRARIYRSLEGSLKRLGTDYLDLYLLHWRGSVPLGETVECMEELVRSGKIRHWGVSNFDTSDMEELFQEESGVNCAVNQVLYHLGSRGIEYDLMPWLGERGIPVMAYCPLAQAGALRKEIMENQVLRETASRYGITVMQLLLAFVMQQEGVAAIPRSGSREHVLENVEAGNVVLEPQDLQRISAQYPPPDRKQPLDIV